MPDEPKPEGQLDLAPIREQLGLAPDAPETDIIAAMLQVIAAMDAKYQELLASSAQVEEEITNRDLADYKDIVTDETAPFWRDNLIANRAGTLAALDKIRAAAKPADLKPAPAAQPLRNRVGPVVAKPLADVVAGASATDSHRAALIRNRAHEIRGREGVPYLIAFNRAERELAAQSK